MEREGARVAAEVPGQWVLIANDAVRGTWCDFESGWRAAEAEDAAHVYLYRAGIDDGDVTFALSPFLVTAPRWTQLGHRFWGQFKLTLEAAGDVWSRKIGGEIWRAAWGDAGARQGLRIDEPAVGFALPADLTER